MIIYIRINKLLIIVSFHKKWKKKIIWFKPTFWKLVNINIGKYVFKLIDKHFNQYNVLHKVFFLFSFCFFFLSS